MSLSFGDYILFVEHITLYLLALRQRQQPRGESIYFHGERITFFAKEFYYSEAGRQSAAGS